MALEHESERVTYGELEQRSNRLAHRLLELGAARGEPVALCLERGSELVVGLLAILKAGGAYVPLDPEYPAERLEYMISTGRLALTLTNSLLVDRLPRTAAGECILLDELDIRSEPATPLPLDIHPEHLVYMIFTSGSTGTPKGAANTHAGLLNRLSWMQGAYSLTPEDVVLQKTPFSFDVSVWEFFWPLVTGARLVLAPQRTCD